VHSMCLGSLLKYGCKNTRPIPFLQSGGVDGVEEKLPGLLNTYILIGVPNAPPSAIAVEGV